MAEEPERPREPRLGMDPGFRPPEGAECVSEGSQVWRLGDRVYRPTAPWTASVHAVLRHLEAAGFDGAPRLVDDGIDDAGRQVLGHIDGELVHPKAWSEDGLVGVARLLRRLHDALADFEQPPGATWKDWFTGRPGDDTVIGHRDTGPWNIVARDGMPVAFIDWEFAGPVQRLDEVAEAARLNCQLHGEDVAVLQGLPPVTDRARHLRLFLDAYGLTAGERATILDRMIQGAVLGCANAADEAQVAPDFTGPHPMVWGMAWQARAARMLVDNRPLLDAVLR